MSILLVSINPVTICMFVCDFEQTHRLLELTLHVHCDDLRRKPDLHFSLKNSNTGVRLSFVQQHSDRKKSYNQNVCVCLLGCGGIMDKRSTRKHEWAITSCFCFPALPAFNEVLPVPSQWYIKAACNSRIGEEGVIEYAGTFILQ